MPYATVWRIDSTKILTRRELGTVLADLKARAARSKSARVNLVLLRLAACCGLRVSEIAGLRLDDVVVGVARPHLRVRGHSAKGGRGRRVPLWWDGGTLTDLADWKSERQAQGARGLDPFITSPRANGDGGPLKRHALRRRFLTACKSLGLARLRTLTIHHGRHTFISHALAGHRSLAEVRDAAGHSNVSVTSSYLHVAVDDDGAAGDVFRLGE